MRILIIADYSDWAFGHIAKDVKKFNQDDSVDIDIIYLNENAIDIAKNIWQNYDIIFIMGWYLYQHFSFIPKNKVITGIHSFCKWDGHLSKGNKTLSPPQYLIDYLSGFLRVNVVSNRLFDLFSKSGLPEVYYTPNGVNIDLFIPKKEMPKKFMAGIVGSRWRWGLKNVNSIFVPATHKSNVDFRILSGESTYDKMPDFYNSLNCYVCASKSEGFSMSCLEAASCGRPIISTDISGTDELITHGKTGFITGMSVDEVSYFINILKDDIEKCKKIGENMREHIIERYSWEKVVNSWTSFIKGEK